MNQLLERGQGKGVIVLAREFAGPGVEQLHCGCSGGELGLEVPRRVAGDALEQFAEQAGLRLEHALRIGKADVPSAIHHVTGQRPGSAGKAEDGNFGA